eukprot:TRINITY_DN1302_c0_g1_i1.p1 TRINITY_DN1302_c0_g1~~TRINITY_DN1302_c0_g1_i1.p1  ORF type:complete len:97 (-),score=3.94 TRINITY_DN1302_c0_g1_i1:236-526(-)
MWQRARPAAARRGLEVKLIKRWLGFRTVRKEGKVVSFGSSYVLVDVVSRRNELLRGRYVLTYLRLRVGGTVTVFYVCFGPLVTYRYEVRRTFKLKL